MNKKQFVLIILSFIFTISCNEIYSQSQNMEKNMFQPRSIEQSDKLADEVLSQMTLDEKISLTGGDKSFFLRAIPRLNLREVYMTDATQGVHIRQSFSGVDLSAYQLEKSTAFPAPILLAATWNKELAYKYAEAVGEECRAGGIGILLGPGMNIYRQSQCGRNFEYFGEDPFLAGSMIENYIKGVQSTGTAGTLKHFAVNNTDYFRRKSNSIVDERTLHEIYLPAFKAGIDAGAACVMTSYNLINGEWAGESEYVINNLLRKQLGFKWLVMTDWWSVYNGEKLAVSGQDLEMPHAIALENAHQLIDEGKVKTEDINRMAQSILRTYFYMRLDEDKKDAAYYSKFPDHELTALETAREGIVLLKNEDGILPVKQEVKNILLTGNYLEKVIGGGGSAFVEGYNNKTMVDELKKEFGTKINYIKEPSIEQIKAADVVLCNVGTEDSEGWDRPFELPEEQEQKVKACVDNNPNTIVLVTSGGGIRMTGWNSKAKAIIYAWYSGQNGNQALAEIISGKVNSSGKLPVSIEKEFKDSPGYGYLPKGEKLYTGWNDEEEKKRSVYDIEYKESVLVGYRWYDTKNIEPLYPFGHGLSYTSFEYSDIEVSQEKFSEADELKVTFKIKNTGNVAGKETAQLYIQDVEASVLRPLKELKGFEKVSLAPGEAKTVTILLDKKAFAFWNPATKNWFAEKGKFVISVGASSRDIRLNKEVHLM